MGSNSSLELQNKIGYLEKELNLLKSYMIGTHHLFSLSSRNIQEDFLNSSFNNLFIIHDELEEYFIKVNYIIFLPIKYKIKKDEIIDLLMDLELKIINRKKNIYDEFTLLLMKLKYLLLFYLN